MNAQQKAEYAVAMAREQLKYATRLVIWNKYGRPEHYPLSRLWFMRNFTPRIQTPS